ncbi:hypothetical protein B0H13DRAFT_2678637 [Mycena leptocephala]|nr:hypothetical protein B0H13DRAFT_2678637 [Mycena leptocephala]
MYARKYIPQTGPRAVLLFPAHPSARLSFIDWAIVPRTPGPILARYYVDILVHSHGLHPSPFYSPPPLSLRCYLASRIAYVITPRRSFHPTSCPPPPALCFRYAAMALSADTSCTATPFRPIFVASISISSFMLHICLHPLSCRFPCLPHAVLVDSDGVDPSPAPSAPVRERCIVSWFLEALGSYAYLSSAPACARTFIPVIRTHDDDKSMCPSRGTLHYTVILGGTFPYSTRIPCSILGHWDMFWPC